MQEINPFETPHPPFAGRKQAYARLYQQLIDPQQAVAYIGRKRSGKTALLRNFNGVFEEHFIGVYLALEDAPLHDEDAWLRGLYQAAFNAIMMTGINTERLPDIPASCENWRDWLHQSALPEVFRVIRPHRRLVYLLDNAGLLIEAVETKKLPKDNPAYLKQLIHPQLGFALALDVRYEDKLDLLKPLINPAEVYRLPNLSQAEIADLFYGAPEAVIGAIHRATGGHPELVHGFGVQLWGRGAYAHLTENDVKMATPVVAASADPLFRQMWQSLQRNERLVLTAVSSLLYSDPLRSIEPEKIETWLVETDYPMDLTTVYSALRSLEYDEILVNQRGGVTIPAGLLQKWLLENARLEPTAHSSGLEIRGQHRTLWIAVAAAVVLFAVLLLAIMSMQSPAPTDDRQPPTVTLAPESQE